MAANKPSFILYTDLLHTVEKLPDVKAGKLFKHILQYVNDLDPKTSDLVLQVTFEPIKQTLKRDLKKYEIEKKSQSDAGRFGNLKRWHPDLSDRVAIKEITLREAEEIAKHRKTSGSDKTQSGTIGSIAVSGIVSVSDNDTVNVNEEKIQGQKQVLPEVKKSDLDLTFDNFLEMRKKIKKPATLFAIDLVKKELEKLAPGDDKLKIEILNQSIRNSWQDVYALRVDKTPNNHKNTIDIDKEFK